MSQAAKWALITGASSGLGKAFAQILISWGYQLIISARRMDVLVALQGDFKSSYPLLRVEVIAADLSEASGAQKLADFCKTQGIVPDLLINNAGFGAFGAFADATQAKTLGMVDVNCRSLTALCQLFLPAMLAKKQGRILNVASMAGFLPGPYMAVYYASKAYVISLGMALDAEVRKSGLRVSTLCPGPVNTEFASVADHKVHPSMAGKIPGPYEVALYGLKKALIGKRIVIYGIGFKFLLFFTRFLSRSLLLRLMNTFQSARVPDSAKHDQTAN